ncbi:MAG TPA: potassium transporter TrkG [Verrucomicrobiota bacterium]|nr:potassium transporter TrkG [Verrucomicrobiota bacterium]
MDDSNPKQQPSATGFISRFRGGGWAKTTLEQQEVSLRAIPFGFAVLILVGTLLLSLPFTHRPGHDVQLVDAFFLATSATCVTGLVTVNVAEDFNLFGQVVLLALIQLGGLGIMTAGTFFVLITGNRLSLAHEKSIAGLVGRLRSARPIDIFIYACVFVFVAELAGFVALFTLMQNAFPDQSIGQSLWQSAFHSVSAFCNAGISIYPDGLLRWKDHPGMLGVVDLLVVAGGIGLLTLVNLRFYYWWRRDRRRRGQLSLQTKLSVTMTLLLLAVGMVFTLVMEWNHTLATAKSWTERLSWSLFHSTMTRTAGFNVTDTGQMQPATLLGSMLLMFIGGAPGSMAGGIKTVTATILILSAWTALRRRDEFTVFNRRVPPDQTAAAIMIVLLMAICVAVSITLLMISENGAPSSQTHHGWLGVAFEAVSGFCTVGLSTGVTPLLTWQGKLIMIAVMFVGRVCPLMLAMHLCRPVASWRLRHPEESVSLG